MGDRHLGRDIAELACALRDKVRQRIASNEAARHLLDAERELLMAARAVIDGKIRWIDSLKDAGSATKPREDEARPG